MDPIHPIVRQAPVIPAVSPSPAVSRVGEQAQQRQREAQERERRRRRARQAESEAQRAYDEASEDDDVTDDDDGRPHIDLTV
jgi:hypothetical protein